MRLSGSNPKQQTISGVARCIDFFACERHLRSLFPSKEASYTCAEAGTPLSPRIEIERKG